MNELSPDEQDRRDMLRLAEGHDAALNDLMERHGQKLFHYLLRQVQDESEANDLAQETFVKVYRNSAKFRAESKFSTWLYTIATNLVRDHFRWRKRHPEVSLEANEEEGCSLGEVLSAVQSLPDDLSTPLLLAEYEEMSQDEIADILKCTRKAVEMRIYRARNLLREILKTDVAIAR